LELDANAELQDGNLIEDSTRKKKTAWKEEDRRDRRFVDSTARCRSI